MSLCTGGGAGRCRVQGLDVWTQLVVAAGTSVRGGGQGWVWVWAQLGSGMRSEEWCVPEQCGGGDDEGLGWEHVGWDHMEWVSVSTGCGDVEWREGKWDRKGCSVGLGWGSCLTHTPPHPTPSQHTAIPPIPPHSSSSLPTHPTTSAHTQPHLHPSTSLTRPICIPAHRTPARSHPIPTHPFSPNPILAHLTSPHTTI